MAQANVVSITGENSEKSVERLVRDEKLADAFRDMEENLIDLTHMARIAFEQASEMVQDIYARHTGDKRHLDQVLFAVSHLDEMINDLLPEMGQQLPQTARGERSGSG
jgi:hypothetical protein